MILQMKRNKSKIKNNIFSLEFASLSRKSSLNIRLSLVSSTDIIQCQRDALLLISAYGFRVDSNENKTCDLVTTDAETPCIFIHLHSHLFLHESNR